MSVSRPELGAHVINKRHLLSTLAGFLLGAASQNVDVIHNIGESFFRSENSYTSGPPVRTSTIHESVSSDFGNKGQTPLEKAVNGVTRVESTPTTSHFVGISADLRKLIATEDLEDAIQVVLSKGGRVEIADYGKSGKNVVISGEEKVGVKELPVHELTDGELHSKHSWIDKHTNFKTPLVITVSQAKGIEDQKYALALFIRNNSQPVLPDNLLDERIEYGWVPLIINGYSFTDNSVASATYILGSR